MSQNSEYYNIYINDELIASQMPFQFALIFVKAIYTEYYAEPDLKVTFERVFPTQIEESAIAEVKE